MGECFKIPHISTMWECCQCGLRLVHSHASRTCTNCGHDRCDEPQCHCKFAKAVNRSRVQWDCCGCGHRNHTVREGFICGQCAHHPDPRSLFKKPPPPTRFNRKAVI